MEIQATESVSTKTAPRGPAYCLQFQNAAAVDGGNASPAADFDGWQF
jgi:hypothetical protein